LRGEPGAVKRVSIVLSGSVEGKHIRPSREAAN
jgi:hypothetical protein